MTAPTRAWRRCVQFNLRSLLVATAILAVALGWWLSLPLRTARDFVRRLERGDHDGAYAMRTSGVQLPKTGTLRLLSLEGSPRTVADRFWGEQRFRVEMHWVDERSDERLYADLRVTRGTLRLTQAGIIEREPNHGGAGP